MGIYDVEEHIQHSSLYSGLPVVIVTDGLKAISFPNHIL